MPAVIRRHQLALAHRPADLPRPSAEGGIVALDLSPDGLSITLAYDLEQVTLPELELRLAAAGLVLSPARLARWQRGWIAFQENNLRDQLKLVHRCCCSPPP